MVDYNEFESLGRRLYSEHGRLTGKESNWLAAPIEERFVWAELAQLAYSRGLDDGYDDGFSDGEAEGYDEGYAAAEAEAG